MKKFWKNIENDEEKVIKEKYKSEFIIKSILIV